MTWPINSFFRFYSQTWKRKIFLKFCSLNPKTQFPDLIIKETKVFLMKISLNFHSHWIHKLRINSSTISPSCFSLFLFLLFEIERLHKSDFKSFIDNLNVLVDFRKGKQKQKFHLEVLFSLFCFCWDISDTSVERREKKYYRFLCPERTCL